MNSKPIIAVTPLYDKNRQSYWMLPAYFQCIEKAGAIPIMLPLIKHPHDIKQIANDFDGFLFTGGDDIDPVLYHEQVKSTCGNPNNERDQFERLLFEQVIERDKPVLGICRGIQLFNVLLGGTLYQDLPTEYLSIINHQQVPPYDIAVHSVNLLQTSPLFELLQIKQLAVNSYHHQAIKDLAPDLAIMAYAEDNLIEAVYRPQSRFLWAVQWHPEYNHLVEPSSQKIIDYFVQHCY